MFALAASCTLLVDDPRPLPSQANNRSNHRNCWFPSHFEHLQSATLFCLLLNNEWNTKLKMTDMERFSTEMISNYFDCTAILESYFEETMILECNILKILLSLKLLGTDSVGKNMLNALGALLSNGNKQLFVATCTAICALR